MDVLTMSTNNDDNNSDVVKLACLHSGSGCENIACLTEFCSIIYAPDLNNHNHILQPCSNIGTCMMQLVLSLLYEW